MLKMFFKVGITSVFFVVLLTQCTNIKYDNAIDLNGDPDPRVLADPTLVEDHDENGRADFFDLRDTTFPVINILYGDTVEIMKDDPDNQLAIYLDKSSISVTDPGGGPQPTISDPVPEVDIFTVRTEPYIITYSAQDSSGNKTTAIRYVKIVNTPVVDKTPPSLSLSQDTIFVTQGGTYVEANITAYDLKDGDLRSQVTKEGTVDVNTPGVYAITYSVTDQAGNPAKIIGYVKVTAEEVVDNIRPEITLIGDDTLIVPDGQTIEEFIAAYVEPGYTATDNKDGDITANVVVSEITRLSVQFWSLTYSVSDAAGNAASPRRRYISTGVTVGIPPAISLTYPDSTFKIILNSEWVEPGFVAVDKEDGDITAQVVVVDTNLTNNLDMEGLYKIVYTVTNSAGLSTTEYREVLVVESEFDTKKPEITLLGKNPDTVLVQSSAAYIDPGYTAIDNRDGDITRKVSVSGTVDMTRLGSNTLSYSVSDLATNRASVTRTVWVVADTNNTDILIRYNVPSADPLPSINQQGNMVWVVENVDGAGPDMSNLKYMSIKWDLNRSAVDAFQFNYVQGNPSWNKDMRSGGNTLDEASPSITIVGSEIEGLDGTYYVTMMGEKFVWVDENGIFAIIFILSEQL